MRAFKSTPFRLAGGHLAAIALDDQDNVLRAREHDGTSIGVERIDL